MEGSDWLNASDVIGTLLKVIRPSLVYTIHEHCSRNGRVNILKYIILVSKIIAVVCMKEFAM